MKYTIKILWTAVAKAMTGLDTDYLLIEHVDSYEVEFGGQYIGISWMKNGRHASATYQNAYVAVVYASQEEPETAS